MIYGFEWIPKYDRQLQYDNKTYRNEYIPIKSSLSYGFEWIKNSDEQKQYSIVLPINKTLILSENQYLKYTENGWKNVSGTLPNQAGFEEHGMEDLSILDRKVQPILSSPLNMTSENPGGGKVFRGKVDLKKIVDLRRLEVK